MIGFMNSRIDQMLSRDDRLLVELDRIKHKDTVVASLVRWRILGKEWTAKQRRMAEARVEQNKNRV